MPNRQTINPPPSDSIEEEVRPSSSFITREELEREIEVVRLRDSVDVLTRTTESMRAKVNEHERVLQQGKGMVLAGRILYVVVGVAISVLVWFFTKLSDVRPADLPKHPSAEVFVPPTQSAAPAKIRDGGP